MIKIKRLYFLFIAATFMLVAWHLSQAQNPDPSRGPENRLFGFMQYTPALGKISLDEGTLEVWFITDFDVEIPLPDDQAILIRVFTSNEKNKYIVAFRKFFYGMALAADGYSKVDHSRIYSAPIKWKAGELHHAAYTWKGKQRSIYIDGIVGDNRGTPENSAYDIRPVYDREGPLEGDLENGFIQIGCSSSPFSIDEIKISSVARSPEEIQKSFKTGPIEDAYTLFIDHCDEKSPADAKALGFRLGGYGHKYVDGKFGSAIRLWVFNKQ